jgi:hypothetical protein
MITGGLKGRRERAAVLTAMVAIVSLGGCTGTSASSVGAASSAAIRPTTVARSAATATWSIAPVVSSVSATCELLPVQVVGSANVQVCSADGKTEYTLGAGMTGRIVQSATASVGAIQSNGTVLQLVFVPAARSVLQQITTVGSVAVPRRQLAIVLDDRVIFVGEIEGPNTDGRIQLVGYTKAQALAVQAGRLP